MVYIVILEVSEVIVTGILARTLRHVFETICLDVVDCLLEAFNEFLEVFLVKENLVLVIRKAAVCLYSSLAFRNSQEEVVTALRCLYIKEISTFPRSDRLGIHILPLTILRVSAVIIFTVHDLLVFC